jgi:hypothetical protein
VLGWEVWREVGGRWALGATEAGLAAAMEVGAIERLPVSPLAHVLMGSLDEAALYVAEADDADTALAEMAQVLDRMVESLRPRA